MKNPSKIELEKRRVENSYGQTSTRLSSAVKSVTTPKEIEGVKDEDGPEKPTVQPINIKVQNGVKEEGKVPAAYTTYP